MLEELREKVCAANKRIHDERLAMFTWGNASAVDRKNKLIVIKPSGVPYDELTPENMVVVNFDGIIVEGDLNPSSDTPTHIALYQSFEEIGAVIHTRSRYATIWAQAGLDIIAYGTAHADYFYGDVPCTVPLSDDQIEEEYEKNTGFLIAETFARRNIDPMMLPACLVAYHGPYVWAKTLDRALENAIVLEEVAHMAVFNTNFQFGLTRIQDTLLDKHYFRRHGDNAYYGQDFKPVTEVTEDVAKRQSETIEDIEIMPSEHTVALKNESQIDSVERPVINKAPEKKNDEFDFEKFIPEEKPEKSEKPGKPAASSGAGAGAAGTGSTGTTSGTGSSTGFGSSNSTGSTKAGSDDLSDDPLPAFSSEPLDFTF